MKSLYVFTIIVACSLIIFAQNDNSNLNFVRVSVFDEYGRYFTGLKPENIVLKEGKETKQVLQLQSEETEPVAVAILIDDDYYPVSSAKTALQFIQKANSANDYSIISYNKTAELLADWKSGDDKIVASLNKIAASKIKTRESVTFDAIALGLEKLKQSALKKNVLLIFGSFYDTKSKTTFDNLKSLVESSDSIIYGVKFYESDGGYIPSRDKNFEKITEISGGRYFDFYLDSGKQVTYRQPDIGIGSPIRDVTPKPSAMLQNLEKEISAFCEMLIGNVEITYLLSYEQKSANSHEKLEIKVNLLNDKGKKIDLKTRFKKLPQT